MTSSSVPDRPQNRVYRKIFGDNNGSPPYTCYFCDNQMSFLEHVHHVDKDPWNNAPDNLVAAHAFCHNSAHHLGWNHSEINRQKISDSVRRRFAEMSSEERQNKFAHHGETNPFYGRSHTSETREKIRRSALGRPGPKIIHTEETKQLIREKIKELPKKWCDTCNKSWTQSHWNRHIRKYHEGGSW